MLKLVGITKDYSLGGGEVVHALKGVSLDFRSSEFVSVLGPSGCGKTTLMNIIGGLDKYTAGDIIIDGKSTKDFGDYEWDNYRNKKIGFVFQSYNLIPHQTVLNNVELALTLSGVLPEERKRRAKEALDKVGLHDQINKKPNQLSGGQMQRVAIARALVNSPDILLADEPTGALDTATSEQIMELIKEIAKDKLVIMVTHNPELAQRYSTRIVQMLDGVILSDSAPFDPTAEPREEKSAPAAEIKKPRKERNKTSMSFITALMLSLKNLFTKKGRTILTAIAGSIGIIGICLILAISNGMNKYIDRLTTDTLSGNPLTITATAINADELMGVMTGGANLDKFPTAQKIFVEKTKELNNIIVKNVITDAYIEYIKNNVSDSLYNDIIYTTGMEINAYYETADGLAAVGNSDSWQIVPEEAFVNLQYDVLYGKFSVGVGEAVLVINEYNSMPDSTLASLGIIGAGGETTDIDFSAVYGKTYYIADDNAAYYNNGTRFVKKTASEVSAADCMPLTIVGIVRIKENNDYGMLKEGLCYSKAFYDALQQRNLTGDIVTYMTNNPGLNPLTGAAYTDKVSILGVETKEEQRLNTLRKLGGTTVPESIDIYPKDFNSKAEIKRILDGYNAGKAEEEKITYTDMSEIMSGMLSSIVNVISYILIAFTAISLIVSCVMIGIITYISVIERTKEIGVLRAIGARKKDITRVFNAETFIIGLFAGVLGVAVTGLLTLPLNAVIKALAGVAGIANLNAGHAFIMIAVSVVLTVVSGLIPAFKASKADPVLALRSE